MKNFTMVCLLIALFSIKANAQCVPVIPSNAIVVNNVDTINGGFDPIWVCGGDSLHSDGGFHNIYLEPGAVMTSGGGIDTIYVKAGASLFLYGGIHFIIFDTISDLYSLGGIPTLDSSCNGIVYDYSVAPSSGCFVPPVADFYANDTSICAGACINFFNQSSDAVTFMWLFQGAVIDSSTDQNPTNICYNSAGDYEVTLIVMNGTGIDTITYVGYIHVDSIPVIEVPAIEICSGQSGILVATGAQFYNWDPPTGLNTNTGDTVIANPAMSSTYTVSGLNNAGCTNLTIAVVTVNQLPSVPVLTINNDTLFASTGYAGYQWYYEGIIISGANNYYYITTQNGNYQLVVHDTKGCEAAAEIMIDYNGVNQFEYNGNEFTINPNPSSGVFTMNIFSNKIENMNWMTTDISGKIIFTGEQIVQQGKTEMKLDWSDLPSGIYYLRIFTNQYQRYKKIVITK